MANDSALEGGCTLTAKTKNQRNNQMKTKMKIISSVALPLCALAVLAACGSTIPVSAHHYPAVSVDSVQMLYQEPKRPYEVIALVGTGGGLRPFVADIGGLRKEA